MIVCHCNCVLAVEIEQSARALGTDSHFHPTAEQVYDALGVQPCCGGCLPLAEAIISAVLPSPAPGPTARARPVLMAAE